MYCIIDQYMQPWWAYKTSSKKHIFCEYMCIFPLKTGMLSENKVHISLLRSKMWFTQWLEAS